MAVVTHHAAERYVERFAPHLTPAEATTEIMLSASAIDIAAAFGAHCVKLANGARLMLQSDRVTTVKLPTSRAPASCAMLKRWGKGRRARDRAARAA